VPGSTRGVGLLRPGRSLPRSAAPGLRCATTARTGPGPRGTTTSATALTRPSRIFRRPAAESARATPGPATSKACGDRRPPRRARRRRRRGLCIRPRGRAGRPRRSCGHRPGRRHERFRAAVGPDCCARADQDAHRQLGFLNQAVYRIGHISRYHDAFHDITHGNNTVTLPSGERINRYRALPGRDQVTGWGSPNAQVLSYRCSARGPPRRRPGAIADAG